MTTKRKVEFSGKDEVILEEEVEMNEEEAGDESGEGEENKDASKVAFGKKFKHTLDSDEEDDEVKAEKYNVLDVEDEVEGQEEKTIDFDGDIKITPFNMTQELEEGHFDKEGNYIFHKDEDIRDNWLDNIDWVKIKDTTKTTSDQSGSGGQSGVKKKNVGEDDEEEESDKSVDIQKCYKDMIELMNPGESIQQTIRRLGKNKSGNKWKKNNQAKSKHTDEENKNNVDKTDDEEKAKLMKMSSLADQVLQTGDMDIYERTYEQLQFHLKSKSDHVEEDMFGDEFDADKAGGKELANEANNDIKWEFKWEDNDDAKVYGPHSTQEMIQWVNEKYFENGVLVRQVGKANAQFYSSKRIDFELYA